METERSKAGKDERLGIRSWLLDNCGGEKQTTRMRDSSVRESQIDFLARRAWVCCVQRGQHENC
jgi:hypothetical protein